MFNKTRFLLILTMKNQWCSKISWFHPTLLKFFMIRPFANRYNVIFQFNKKKYDFKYFRLFINFPTVLSLIYKEKTLFNMICLMAFKKIKSANRVSSYYLKLWLREILHELTLLVNALYRQYNSRKSKLKNKKSKN